MNQGMMNTVISAVVGGVIGAGVVFFGAAKSTAPGDLSDLTIANLKVENLTITQQASLLNKEGKEEVVIKDGSVLAENVMLAKKVIGRQFQGHAFVANRVFTTPDDLFSTPMESWRFFAEIGSSAEAGGEIVVRSANGAASVNKATTSGALLRAGYDPEGRPQILALQNYDRSPLQINHDLSEMQRRMLSQAAPPNAAAQAFDSNSSVPMGGPQTATMPDANTMQR